MLEHLDGAASARRLMAAIERVTGDATVLPRDLGGTDTTQDVTEAVAAVLRGRNTVTPGHH